MVVPELSADIRELKARAARFVEEHLYPAEERIAETGEIDDHEIHELKEKARAEGFSNYNLPAEYEGPDLPMLQGLFLVFSAAVIVMNLGADLLYSYLDPRVRTE